MKVELANTENQKLKDESVVFPFGKYKDQQVLDICNKDRNYCLWWMHNVITNSVIIGRVKDVIAKQYLPTPKVHRSASVDSEAYCDTYGSYDDDLMEVYDFAMYDGGGAPFLI